MMESRELTDDQTQARTLWYLKFHSRDEHRELYRGEPLTSVRAHLEDLPGRRRHQMGDRDMGSGCGATTHPEIEAIGPGAKVQRRLAPRTQSQGRQLQPRTGRWASEARSRRASTLH